MANMKKVVALMAAMTLTAGICTGCGENNNTQNTASSTPASVAETSAEATGITKSEDLKDKKVGVQNGTTGAIIAGDFVSEEEGGEVMHFSTYSETILSLLQDKIDCVIMDEQPAKVFVAKNEGLKIVDQELTDEDYAAVIAKSNTDLLESVNKAMAELKEDGTLDKIIKSYIPEDGEEGGTYHYQQTVTEGDTLVMATSADFPPYEYREGDNIVGIDVEIASAIADKLGRVLKVNDMKFDSIISAVDSGKADIGFSGFTVTDERKKQINFTDNYAHSKQVMVVKEK